MPAITKQVPNQSIVKKGQWPVGKNFKEVRSAWQLDEGIKLLLYGRSGTGKTTLWSSFPKPILAFICSGGLKPGELRSIDTPENRKNIQAYVVDDLDWLREVLKPGGMAEKSGAATIVLDHASGLQDHILMDILGLDEIPVQKSWGLATQQEYGQCTMQSKEILRRILGASKNVVIVAQERDFKTEGDSSTILPSIGAGLMPKLADWLNQASDYICNTYIRQKEEIQQTTVGKGKDAKVIKTAVPIPGQVEYCLRTAPDPVYATKFRLPRSGNTLPSVIVDPSYGKIEAIIRGTYKDS